MQFSTLIATLALMVASVSALPEPAAVVQPGADPETEVKRQICQCWTSCYDSCGQNACC
jgi:hypothetical protein